jgi:Ca2+/Na+ antiporter
LILGLTALISPIAVSSRVLVKELPILFMTTLIAGYQLIDKEVTGTDGWVLLFSGNFVSRFSVHDHFNFFVVCDRIWVSWAGQDQ